MITIIHGEDVVKSRNYFLDEKQKHADAIYFDGRKLTNTDIIQALEGNELFSTTKIIFIEEFFSKRKQSKETDEIITIILHNQDAHVYFWESKDLSSRELQIFKQATIKQFKLPQTIFAFLDAIKPHNGKTILQLFHKTLSNDDEQFVFFMLIRHIRLLLALYEGSTGALIEEVRRMAPWQKNKMQKQAKHFTLEQLMTLYNKLFQFDLGQKTGTLSLSLARAIDFLLLEI